MFVVNWQWFAVRVKCVLFVVCCLWVVVNVLLCVVCRVLPVVAVCRSLCVV